MDKIFNDTLGKNNKNLEENSKLLLEKFRHKIKGMVVKGDIKSKDDLNKIFDQAEIDFDKEIIDPELKNKLFKEWRDKNEAQLSNLILEDEKKRNEKTKKFMADKLEHISSKLQAKEKEIEEERTRAYNKADEMAKERDEAQDVASKLRIKISEIIKEKMKHETEFTIKFQKLENEYMEKLKAKDKEIRLLNEKLN